VGDTKVRGLCTEWLQDRGVFRYESLGGSSVQQTVAGRRTSSIPKWQSGWSKNRTVEFRCDQKPPLFGAF